MTCSYKARGGAVLTINGEDVYLKYLFLQETCKMQDIIAIRYVAPSIWKNGSICILTRQQQLAAQNGNLKEPMTYNLFFTKKNSAEFEALFQELLRELRMCHNAEGVCRDSWWAWD